MRTWCNPTCARGAIPLTHVVQSHLRTWCNPTYARSAARLLRHSGYRLLTRRRAVAHGCTAVGWCVADGVRGRAGTYSCASPDACCVGMCGLPLSMAHPAPLVRLERLHTRVRFGSRALQRSSGSGCGGAGPEARRALRRELALAVGPPSVLHGLLLLLQVPGGPAPSGKAAPAHCRRARGWAAGLSGPGATRRMDGQRRVWEVAGTGVAHVDCELPQCQA